jgi:hypothetical protein
MGFLKQVFKKPIAFGVPKSNPAVTQDNQVQNLMQKDQQRQEMLQAKENAYKQSQQAPTGMKKGGNLKSKISTHQKSKKSPNW